MPYPQQDTLRCNSCKEIIPTENHGPTENKKVYIMACPHCGFTRVRPLAGRRFETITEGDTVDAFWEIFPTKYITQVDEFAIGRETLLKGADKIPDVEQTDEGRQITDLIID